MKRYVLGFLFPPNREGVLLIQKARPEWQRGKWNGIGGHIEAGETPHEAMAREATEETGVTDVSWELFVEVRGVHYEMFVFRAFDREAYLAQTIGGDAAEEVALWSIPDVTAHESPVIPNLRWLVPMALDPIVANANVWEGDRDRRNPVSELARLAREGEGT